MPHVLTTNGIQSGHKTAVLIPALQSDKVQYEHTPNEWAEIDNEDRDQVIAKVRHINQSTTEVGEIVTLRSFVDDSPSIRVRIDSIQLTHVNHIDDDAAQLLGFADRESFVAQSTMLTSEWAWIARISPIKADVKVTVKLNREQSAMVDELLGNLPEGLVLETKSDVLRYGLQLVAERHSLQWATLANTWGGVR